tara:strand:+ start:101 stop:505 length:405 start_codon:yes stop_codon:yes gene_type:complete
MKTLTIFISILVITLLSSPTWSETLTIDDLVERDGLVYKKFTNVPFTGEITGIDTGQFKDGKKEGYWEFYHYNGQLSGKGNMKEGRMEGLWFWYSEDGYLHYKGQYCEGNRRGLWKTYRKDGSVKETTTYWKCD